MSTKRPDWLLDSPYFYYNEKDEWDLKEEAPAELKKKLKEYKEEKLQALLQGRE